MSYSPQTPNLPSWNVINAERVYDANPYVAVDVETVKLPDGRIIDNYHQVHLADFSVAVPVLDDGSILTQWQYKHAVKEVSLTFPAGQIDVGESAEDAMRRELREETGYVAQRVIPLGSYWVNGNQGCGTGHLFAMTGCVQRHAPSHNDLEDWDLQIMAPHDVDAAMRDGQIKILPHMAVWLAYKASVSANDLE